MSTGIVRYSEPLDVEELRFLEKKAATDTSNYYKVFQVLMIGSFVIPFAGAWYRAFDGMVNAFSPFRFFSCFASSVISFARVFKLLSSYSSSPHHSLT